jgi:CBS domain-containing protein
MLAKHQEFLETHLQAVSFQENEVIASPEDGNADHYFIITEGRVRGETPGGAQAWELDSGESFPIGALLANRPVRTVHRAITPTTCLKLNRDDFQELLKQSEAFHDFCTRRLANMLDEAMRLQQADTSSNLAADNSLNTPLRDLLSPTPVSCSPDTRIEQALRSIESSQRRSIAIVDEQNQPVGILTLRDVLSRITLARKDISSPVKDVMTPLTTTLSPDEFAYQAAIIMAEQGVGHVCVVDDQHRFLGLLSERDLFSLQRIGLGNLSRAIKNSSRIEQLKQLSRDIVLFTDQMLAQGASVLQLMKLITTLNDLMTQKVISLCEAKMDIPGPAIRYTWLSFGSEGREEQTLKTDQDNGILFNIPEGETADSCREKLLPLATQINQSLAEVGFPLCPGNIMASNPECCLSFSEWQNRFQQWIDSASPENLLKASIFFDFRPIYGAPQPANELFAWLSRQTSKNSLFRRHMAQNALRISPPLGLFRDFVVSSGGDNPNTIDIKLKGITPFVDAARLFSLAHEIRETNTIARLQKAADKGVLNKENVDAWTEAYQYIQLLRMRNHREQSRQGKKLSNHINPDKLNELERRILKEAFRQARKLQSKVGMEYQL